LLRESSDSVIVRQPVPRETVLEIVQRYGEGLVRNPGVRDAWLFGSYARGDHKVGSDIDLCVVVYGKPSKKLYLALISGFYEISTEAEVQLHLYSARDFDTMLSEGIHFVREIVSQGIQLVRSGELVFSSNQMNTH